MRILLAEDEVALARALVRILEKNNYTADAVYNGEDAVKYLENGSYDAMILDIMMPRLDGIGVLRRIRAMGNEIPVLILSAKSEVDDKVHGLDCGANDYLTKPFDTKELLARLRSITRPHHSSSSLLSMGNITLDRASNILRSPSGSFRLANKEFQIMELLLSNQNTLISTERILEKIWGYDSDAELNVVWVYISYLRKKLISLQASIRIRASRNAGYVLEEIT